MNTIKKAIKKQATRLLKVIATREMNEWPPVCCGFLYQPERPQQVDQSETADK